jgi:hypothetical protein
MDPRDEITRILSAKDSYEVLSLTRFDCTRNPQLIMSSHARLNRLLDEIPDSDPRISTARRVLNGARDLLLPPHTRFARAKHIAGVALTTFLLLISIFAFLLALVDIVFSTSAGFKPGDVLSFIVRWPRVRFFTLARLRPIVSFAGDFGDAEVRHPRHFPDVAYALPRWWVDEYCPPSPLADALFESVDAHAAVLWVEHLKIQCALERQRDEDSGVCWNWETAERVIKAGE